MDDLIKNILVNIMKINTTTLEEPFFDAVLKRLASFGYEPTEEDCWVICFTTGKVENHIKNSCNITSIPEGLFHIAVHRVCGEFLFTKKQTGKLDIENLDLTGAIKQISEGDTSVTFGDGTSDEEKFNLLVNYLLSNGEGDLLCFRKLRW